MSLRCTIGFIKKKILKTIGPSDDGAHGQKGAMNPSGAGIDTIGQVFLA